MKHSRSTLTDLLPRLLMKIFAHCPQEVAWMKKIGQARQHSTSILPALRTPGDSRKKDHCSPQRMKYCLNSPLLKPSSSDSPPAKAPLTVRIAQSRGTEESEGQIWSRLRSSRSFDHSMRDDLVRLFHTPDTLTGQERTTDYWVQLPGYWIRMVHRARTDTVHPDIEPSPIQGPLGDCLMANRYTYFVWSQFPESIGHEIEDLWCPVITPDGIEKNPEEDPSRELYQAWKGFVVFATQSIELEKVGYRTASTNLYFPQKIFESS